jgi:Fe-S-cluster-containing dehydrogenase component
MLEVTSMVNYGFVINNRTCIGCHACTVACKSEHDVPIGVNRTHVKYIETGEYPNTSREFAVHRCNHCEDSPCTTICPTSALFQRDDGIVDFDDERCIGCKSCMQACPYDALYIDPNKGTAAKCNYCAHRIENSFEPACVIVCPTESIVSGDLDDPNSSIAMLIADNEVTVRKPESGANPNLYYIEASQTMLDPAATDRTGAGVWTTQEGGVGHFAKYADKRLDDADTPSMIVQLALEKKAKAANPRDRAIIHDVMAKLESDGGPKAKRVYDAPSKGILWDWEVAGYLVTKSAASGLYILMMLAIISGKLVFSSAIAAGLVTSIALLGATGLLLVKDLDKPMRFIYVLLRPNWSSWLVRGGYTLGIFGNLMVAHLAIFALNLPPQWHIWLAVIGIPFAWLTGSYTGWLFKQAKGREVWANRSNSSIALTGTIEMVIFGAVPFTLVILASIGKLDIITSVLTAIGVGAVFWFGYNHILHGLRKAQMEPLI